MATYTRTNSGLVINSQDDTDVLVIETTRAAVRNYLDDTPIDDLTTALDEAQAAVEDGGKSIIVIVVSGDTP